MGLREAIDRVNEAIENSKEISAKLSTKQRKSLKKAQFCFSK